MASDDPADTAARPKPIGKKAKKLSQREQSERFIETARTLEADESGERFDKAMRALVPPKQKKDF